MIPGHHNNKGRCYGVIDTYSFVEMLDAVQLLEKSKAFTTKDSKQLKAWFGKLLTWILNSPQGQEEANQANNHSTAHDAQVIAFALYAGNVKVAQEVINAIPKDVSSLRLSRMASNHMSCAVPLHSAIHNSICPISSIFFLWLRRLVFRLITPHQRTAAISTRQWTS